MKEAYTHAQISRNNELKDTLILTTGDIGRYFCSSCVFPHLCWPAYVRNGDMRYIIYRNKMIHRMFTCEFPLVAETLVLYFLFTFEL